MNPTRTGHEKNGAIKKHVNTPCRLCGSPHAVVNGLWLRKVRLDAGITLRDMGRRVGFSAVYLSDVERNRRNRLPAICAHYERLV